MNSIRYGFLVVLVVLFSLPAPVSADDGFIRGYASAVLEREFHVAVPSTNVENGTITLKADEIRNADSGGIITELLKIQGVRHVEIVGDGQVKAAGATAMTGDKEERQAAEFSETEKAGTPLARDKEKKLFEPLIADPRWPHFSMSYQYYTHDSEFGNIFAASFGETLPLYTDEAPFGGKWQVAIQAAGFIVHDLDTASWDLINEDYFGGVSLFYRRDAVSGLFGIYHNSSHVGDEFLLHNDVDRVNFSYEATQLKLSYDISEPFRVYVGTDYLFSPDPKELKRWVTQYGFEFNSPNTYLKGLFRPVAGADFKNRQENHWHSEVSLRAGLQMEVTRSMLHRIQFMLEYYNGNSPNGQFHDNLIEFIGLGTHFYF